jgi:hypothetical protein
MQKSSTQTEFERWAKDKGLDMEYDQFGCGTYNDSETEAFWECWKVATNMAFETL